MSLAIDAPSLLRTLQEERPRFHVIEGESKNSRIDPDVLLWLAQETQPGARTLETGAGYSTIVMTARGAVHTSISPAPYEHAAIRTWLEEHGVDTGQLTFHEEPSEKVLPSLDTGPLDFVLVDGNHGFPWPFLDWFYTAEALKVGGRLIVDDTNIRSGHVLRGFLLSEKGRWRHLRDFRKATLFEKVAADVLEGKDWYNQPWQDKKLKAWRRLLT